MKNCNRLLSMVVLWLTISLSSSWAQNEVTYGFVQDPGDPLSITAVAIPNYSSTNVTISTAVFSFLLPEGTITNPLVSPVPSTGAFNNINGIWAAQLVTPTVYGNVGFNPADLMGNDVYQVVLQNSPIFNAGNPVVAGTPIPLFSFSLPADCMGGNVEVLTNDSPIQMAILNNLGANFNNQMSMSVNDAPSVDIYVGNDPASSILSCPLDDVPLAVDDVASTDENTPVNIDVLTNDDFGNNGPSGGTIIVTVAAMNGTTTINNGGTPNDPSDDSINYTPNNGFTGTDVLTYQICDADGDCDNAVVTINVLDALIGIAKSASPPAGNGNGTFTTTITMTVENLGQVDLGDVQVSDDLSVFGTSVSLVDVDMPGEYNVSNLTFTSNSADPLSVNTAFDGTPANSSLLDVSAGGTLAIGEVVTLSFDLTFYPAVDSYINEAVATGDVPFNDDPTGSPDDDPEDTSDTSTNGANPDPNDDGEPIEDEPTPIDPKGVTYCFVQDMNDPLMITAVAIPDYSSVDVTLTTAVFSFLLPAGTPTDPSVPTSPSTGAFLNITGMWDAQVVTPGVYAGSGFDPADLMGNDVYQVVLQDSPEFTASNPVVAGVPIELFSFRLPANCPGGSIEVLANDSPIQMAIFTNLGANFNNQISMSVDNVPTVDVYLGADPGCSLPCPLDDIPLANNDVASTDENTPVNISVLLNDDFGTNGPSMGTITLTIAPLNGTAVVNNGGTPSDPSDDTVDYTPNNGFDGTDTFTYQICDADGDCDDALVTVNVLDAQIGIAKSATTPAGNGNGTFTTTITMTVENFGQVDLGDIQVLDDLSAFGTPVGLASVDMPGEYNVSNLMFTSNSADPLSVNPAFNGIGANASLLDVSAGGTLAIGEVVTLSFDLTLYPAQNSYINQAIATGDVPFNDDPTGSPDDDPADTTDDSVNGTDADPNGNGDPSEDGPTPIDPNGVTYCFEQDPNDPFLITAIAIPDYSSIDVTISTAVFSFLLPEGTITDPAIPSSPGTGAFTNITGMWDAQAVTPTSYSNAGFNPADLMGFDVYQVVLQDSPVFNSGNPVIGGVPIELFSFRLPSDCMGGDIQVLTNSSSIQMAIFTNLGANFNNQMSMSVNGATSVDVYLGNEPGCSIPCPIDDMPEAIDDVATTNESTPVNIVVLTNDDFGADGPSTGTITLVSGPANGTATVNDGGTPNDPTDDTFDYTPNTGYDGGDSFTYQICDSDGDCDVATVNVTVLDALIGVAKAASIPVNNGDGSFTTTFTITVENFGEVVLGDIQVTDDLSAFGAFVPLANLDMEGEYTVSGLTFVSNSADPLGLNMGFNGASDTELLDVAAGGRLIIDEVVTLSFNLRFIPAQDTYTNVAVASGDVPFNDDPTGSPDNDPADTTDDSTDGTDPDPDGDRDPQEDTPTPIDPDDLPVANDDTASTDQDVAVNIDPLPNDDFGSDGPSVGTITVVVQPSNGTATVNNGGTTGDPTDDTIDYTPDNGFIGDDFITYRICDSDGDCSNAVITVTVLPTAVKLLARVRLQGALYQSPDGLMRDDLRQEGELPASEPYSSIAGFTHISNTMVETIASPATVYSDYGTNSIVDWVFVELRSAVDPATVLFTRSGLLQRDGDIVDVDGVSPLTFEDALPDMFYVAVRHRNHNGTMTANPIMLTATGTIVDFTDINLSLWENLVTYDGLEQAIIDNAYALWAGNTNADENIIYAGQSNDKDPVFNEINSAPGNFFGLQTYIFPGYNLGDVDMNANTVFAGQNNDIDPIFNNMDGYPANIFNLQTYVIPEQLAK
jgi:hypothetical protein